MNIHILNKNSFIFALLVLLVGCKEKNDTSFGELNPTNNSYPKSNNDDEKLSLQKKYPQTYQLCKNEIYAPIFFNSWTYALNRSIGTVFEDCDNLLRLLSKQKRLNLAGYRLDEKNINVISELTQLEFVNLSNNKISNLKLLNLKSKSHALNAIDLTNNPLTDLSGLENFTNLQEISIRNNIILNEVNEVNFPLKKHRLIRINVSYNNTIIRESFYGQFNSILTIRPAKILNSTGFIIGPPPNLHYLTNELYDLNGRDIAGRTREENNAIRVQAERQQRDQAARDLIVRQQREQAARDQAARDLLIRQQRDQAARDLLIRQQRDQAARDLIARQQREQAARDQAARDLLIRQQREQAARDLIVRQQREQEDYIRIDDEYRENIRNYLAEGKYQHAIWFTLKKLDSQNLPEIERQLYTESLELLYNRINDTFENTTSENVQIEDFPHGHNQKYEITFPVNNIKGIFKIHGPNNLNPIVGTKMPSNAAAEFAAYQLDQLLDLRMVPFTIMREFNIEGRSVLGSLQLKIEALPVNINDLTNNNVELNIIETIDYILGNADRFNGGNLLTIDLAGEEKLIAIDFSEAFSTAYGGIISNNVIYNGRNIQNWDIIFNGNFNGLLNQLLEGQEIFPNLMPNRVKEKIANSNFVSDIVPIIDPAIILNPRYLQELGIVHSEQTLKQNIQTRFEIIKQKIGN